MRPILLLNDVHLGVQRSGGTTPKSAAAIREYLLDRLSRLMYAHLDHDIIINGDLFDTFNAPLTDVLGFHDIASTWLHDSAGRDMRGGRLILGRGNHDWSKDSSKLSSFDFVARLLRSQYGSQHVRIVTEPESVAEGVYMIPHMPNQDLFDIELAKLDNLPASTVLLHANYDNHFAVEADHSLNVSAEQAQRLVAKGHSLVFGHEHQKREPVANILVTGNQWPSSVADCLRNPENRKTAHVLHAIDEEGRFIEPVFTWEGDAHFAEVPWDALHEMGTSYPDSFIRVTGDATAIEAPQVIAAIAKFRAASDAFVVSNAVRIDGVREMDELASVSMEEIKAFDVMAYLFENLDPPQVDAVKALLAKRDAGEERMAA